MDAYICTEPRGVFEWTALRMYDKLEANPPLIAGIRRNMSAQCEQSGELGN
jgi:hypothetical protein